MSLERWRCSAASSGEWNSRLGSGMPHFWATERTASGKLTFSIFWTKVKTSPDWPQPKQWKNWRPAWTEKEGVFSEWKGQSPEKFWASAYLRRTYSPMILTMSACCLTFWAKSVAMAKGLSKSVAARGGYSRPRTWAGVWPCWRRVRMERASWRLARRRPSESVTRGQWYQSGGVQPRAR